MFKSFNNLRIGVRIIIGFFIIVAIACIIGVVGIQNLKNVQDSYALDYESTVDALEYVERISSHFQQIRVNVFGFALSYDSDEKREYYTERIAEHINTVNESINGYREILSKYDASEVETEMKLLDNIQAALNEFGVLRNKMMNDLQTGLISREEFVSSF